MIATTGGFTCMYCGMFVVYGVYHECQPQFTAVSPTYTFVDPALGKLNRIIELLEELLKEVR